jgi:hypothetical protein
MMGWFCTVLMVMPRWGRAVRLSTVRGYGSTVVQGKWYCSTTIDYCD